MPKSTIKFLGLLLLFLLALPQGIFARVNATSQNAAPAMSEYTMIKVVTQQTPVVTVKQVLAPVATVVNSATSCKLNFAPNSFALQESGALNLNQPANCFSLSVASRPSAEVSISIQTPAQATTQVVVLKTSFWKSFSFHPTEPFQSLPVLPVMPIAWAVLLVALLGSGFVVVSKNYILANQFSKTFNLHELQVMRC